MDDEYLINIDTGMLFGNFMAAMQTDEFTEIVRELVVQLGPDLAREVGHQAFLQAGIAFDVDAAIDRILIDAPTFYGVQTDSGDGRHISYRQGQRLHSDGRGYYVIERMGEEGWRPLIEWPLELGELDHGALTWVDWLRASNEVTSLVREGSAALEHMERDIYEGPGMGLYQELDGLELVAEIGGPNGILAGVALAIDEVAQFDDRDNVSPLLDAAAGWLRCVKEPGDLDLVIELINAGFLLADPHRLALLRAEFTP